MKNILNREIVFALLLTAVPLAATAQTTFFKDTYANGSTINSASPVAPTANSTSYETISSIAQSPLTTSTNYLQFGCATMGGGNVEQIQALFATNAIALVQPGDYIQLTVVFTNTAGIFCAGPNPIEELGFGLYNSGQVLPLAGGLNGTEGNSTPASGGAQDWAGYVAQVSNSGSSPKYELATRPSNAGTANNNNQDLLSNGSSTKSYAGLVALATGTALVIASTNQVNIDVLTITLNGANSLAITNVLYTNTATAGGTPATTVGSIATNANFLTGGFDAFAIGFYKKTDSSVSNLLDIASITVSGSVTVISGPPTITLQPVPVTVATNGACAFIVNANGFDVTYQWHRNGTNLIDGPNISGSTGSGASSTLVISPAGTNDALPTTTGYYVTVTGAGNFSTNSVTNSLTLVAATNLIWTDANSVIWDLNNSVNWQDNSSNPQVFNFGDPVTFSDVGAGGNVTLTGPYLSAASVTVSNTIGRPYVFGGSGSFAGPGNLIYDGPKQFTLNNVNTYSGGTIISNASANLLLENYAGLGTGPVTLLQGGAAGLETAVSGSASSGIAGDVVVGDDFTIQYDALGAFAINFLGNVSGTSGKTLTFVENVNNNASLTNNKIRISGVSMTNNANIVIGNSDTVLSPNNASGIQVYNGVISGVGTVEEKGFAIFNATNTFSGSGPFLSAPGGMILAAGNTGVGTSSTGSPNAPTGGPFGTGPLSLWVDSTSASPANSAGIYASGGARTIHNTIQYPSSTNNLTLIVNGTNDLTFTGSINLSGLDAFYTNPIPNNMVIYSNRTFQVTNTGLTTLSGVISDLTNGVSAAYGFIKTGSGVLALNNTETYTGPTTVSGGTLQINGSLNAASAVTVTTNAILAGSGTINGPVTINRGGALAPGAASIGTLTINNGLTNSGNINVRVNRSGFVSDNAVVSGALTNAGTGIVTVTNFGAALQSGDAFTLFNKALTNGAAMTVTGAGMSWQNNLAVNGTIVVIGPSVLIPTNSARITSFNMVSGNVVINGTNGQSGGTYYLLSSTNVAKPLGQWTAVATNIVNTNGAANNAFTFTGTNAVTPNSGQQFYILSNTNN